MNDLCHITGRIHFVLRDENGKIKDERDMANLITTAGKALAAQRFKDATSAAIGWIAVGTSGTAEAVGDTALGAEIVGGRVATSTPTVTANAIAYVSVFGAGVGTGAIQEAGLLNASTSGTLASHKTFAVINKGASDSLTVSWTLTFN